MCIKLSMVKSSMYRESSKPGISSSLDMSNKNKKKKLSWHNNRIIFY